MEVITAVSLLATHTMSKPGLLLYVAASDCWGFLLSPQVHLTTMCNCIILFPSIGVLWHSKRLACIYKTYCVVS